MSENFCFMLLKWNNVIHLFLSHAKTKAHDQAWSYFLLLIFSCHCWRDYFATLFNQVFYTSCYDFVDFYGGIIKPTKRRKKSKLQKVLEEGDLLFNLVMSIWFLFLVFLFKGIFKLVLPYKSSVFVFNLVVSGFMINLIFKIVDIYTEYTKETLSERIQKEILEKRKLKPPL